MQKDFPFYSFQKFSRSWMVCSKSNLHSDSMPEVWVKCRDIQDARNRNNYDDRAGIGKLIVDGEE